MKTLSYQVEAIRKLKDYSNNLLSLEGNHTIVFKSPTGSGKTYMVAEYLKQLVEYRSDDRKFSFLWTAPRKLHTQSKTKLENHFRATMALKCSTFEDLIDRNIDENEILFLNWESINREENIYYRENEREFYLEKIIEKTREEGRTIVLVIDESHHTAGAENTQSLIHMIGATLTIEVTATPKIAGNEMVTVQRQRVIEEEMIKKEVVINPGFANALASDEGETIRINSSAHESTNEFIIRTALEKRDELKKHFEELGSNVNPLMLIQLPDRSQGQTDYKDEIIEILSTDHGIDTSNGRLAIYLAEDKENLAAISKLDNPVEVMIFKQAIALGWDCPRASILALFRDWQNIVFSIQTLGRIMRMPELIHYEIDELNAGYVFTNLSDIAIHQEIADGYALIQQVKRIDQYSRVDLLSYYPLRQRERTRLSPEFIRQFLESTEELKLAENIDCNIEEISKEIISDIHLSSPDQEIDQVDDLENEDSKGTVVQIELNTEEIDHRFNQFAIGSIAPFYPEERSIKRINSAIYRFFEKKFPGQYDFGGTETQMIVLAEKNQEKFINVVNHAKAKYLAKVSERGDELAEDPGWEVPQTIYYSAHFDQFDKSLSVVQPYFESKSASDIEHKFAEYLDSKPDEIEWWFKNGERDRKFLAVPYMSGDSQKPFYVDWIVKFMNKSIGLFDTKAGITAEIAGPRAEGLNDYIKSQSKNKRKIIGGIIIYKDGSFWCHSGEDYSYDESNLTGSGWKIFLQKD